jgi:hypothetical protein
MRLLSAGALIVLHLTAGILNGDADQVGQLRRSFLQPPDDARVMMRWWWFGPAVTREGIERDLRAMKAAGLGGFEVQPVYPLTLDDPKAGVRNHPFLSPEFLDALRFTATRAKELGLRFDLTLGTGWPYGGPHIPLEHSATRLRFYDFPAREGPPSLADGERLIAAYTKEDLKPIPIEEASMRPGSGSGKILYFVESHTGQKVKRASLGGEGYVLDHYSRVATNLHLRNVGDRLLDALGDQRPHAIFCDSLESFGADWTPELFAEFQRRRGYDLREHLPALVTDVGPRTKGIRHDWGLTLTELLEDRFLSRMREWSTDRKVRFRIQAYGVPPAILSSARFADFPEGEGNHWKQVSSSRWASSASHLFGRGVTSSETWTWLHSPSFRATPLDLKAEADLHFLQGINQLIGHGWPYSPEREEFPGWRFYAAGALNDRNPWWGVMPDLQLYLQRVSFLMRQGRPVNDVALYLPTSDAYASFQVGKVHMIEVLRKLLGTEVIAAILEGGYGFDLVDDRTLQSATIGGGQLAMGEGRYRSVVLPSVQSMPANTLRKLAEFRKEGGSVVAINRRPTSAPGWRATEREHREVANLAAKITSDPVDVGGLGAVLQSQVPPDVRPTAHASEVGFVHRTTPNAEIYFIANTANRAIETSVRLRDTLGQIEMWDARTGEMRAISTPIRLSLAPYESKLIVSHRGRPLPPSPRLEKIAERPLPTQWQVKFEGQSKERNFSAPQSWTEVEDLKHYSGTATYTQIVQLTESDLQKGTRWELDFGPGASLPMPPPEPQKPSSPGMRAWFEGPVREAAVVYVNNKRAGSVWTAPYSVDLTPYLRAGENWLRIVVGNTAINHLAGQPAPDYKELRAKYGNRFDPQDMDNLQPIPSGLLHPLKLVIYGRRRLSETE